MMQKALLYALLIITAPCGRAYAAAADVSIIKKQFMRLDPSLARLDSLLARCAGLPEVRMKEIAPFDGVAKRMLALYPEIAAVLRTNSKGTVVNCVRRAEGGESMLRADVSGQQWYAMAKPGNSGPYYGPLHTENGRANCIWSRPLSITMPVGGNRFGGVVAIFIDIPQAGRPSADSAAPQKQKESVRSTQANSLGPEVYDKKKLRSATGSPLVETQAVPDTVPDSVSGRTGGGKTPAFLKIAGIVAVLLVLVCLWLIFSTLRRRQPARPSGNAVQPSMPVAEQPPKTPADDSVKSEDENAATTGPARVDVPDFLLTPAASVPAETGPSAAAPPPSPAPDGPLENSSPVPEEIRNVAAKQVRDEVIAQLREELLAEMREKITDEQRNEIYRKELVNTTAAIRRQIIDNEMTGLVETLRKQFAAEMRQHIIETMSASIEEQERSAIVKEAAEKIRAEEYDAIVRAERDKLSESVRMTLAEEESARLTADALEKLRDEIARAVRENEEETVRAAVREEMTERIRRELLEGEKDLIAEEQTRKVEAELYDEISRKQGDAIRASVIEKITEDEHRRIDSGLRETIVDDEKQRIIAEESDELRAGITAQIRLEEVEAMRRTIRDEIYAETVQAIKRDLEEKYQTVVEEKMAGLKVALRKKIRADISASIKADYDRLMEHTDRLSSSLTNVEALQSLSQTVTLLSDEKKKFKYLNLNTAQTESLLEYLRRVNNRLNIFFDKVDESVRELMLNLGSVKNKLDDNG